MSGEGNPRRVTAAGLTNGRDAVLTPGHPVGQRSVADVWFGGWREVYVIGKQYRANCEYGGGKQSKNGEIKVGVITDHSIL